VTEGDDDGEVIGGRDVLLTVVKRLQRLGDMAAGTPVVRG
jgi:hypothetical protein